MSHVKQVTTSFQAPQRARSRWLVPTVVVAALVIAGAAGTGRLPIPWRHAAAPAPAAAPPAMPVSVAAVERRDAVLWESFSGRLEAVGRVDLRPRVAGAITEVHFREGSLVHKGDVLFSIDAAPFAAEVQRTDAQVATARAELVLATKEQGRAQRLVATSAVPLRDLDQRVSALAGAEASVRSAEAQLAVARLNLGWTTVRAPIDGRVGRIEVTPGNLVSAGPTAPVLTTLVSVDPIYASFEADEQTVARAMGTLPQGRGIEAIPVELGTLAASGTPITGTLQFVDNVVNAQTGTVRLRGSFANVDGRLTPGQFARIRLGEPRPQSIVAVAERAIGTDQDRRFVFVVGDDGKAVNRAVKLGAMADGLRIVTAGLEPGERVIVDGLQRVRPGATLAPKLVAMPRETEAAAP